MAAHNTHGSSGQTLYYERCFFSKSCNEEFIKDAMWLTMSKDGKSFKLPFHREFLKRHAASTASPIYCLATIGDNEVDIGQIGSIRHLDVDIAHDALCLIGDIMYHGESGHSRWMGINRARFEISHSLGLCESTFMGHSFIRLIVGGSYRSIGELVDGLKWARDGPIKRASMNLDAQIEENLQEIVKRCWDNDDGSVLNPLSAEMQADINVKVMEYGRKASKYQKRKLEQIQEIAAAGARRRTNGMRHVWNLSRDGLHLTRINEQPEEVAEAIAIAEVFMAETFPIAAEDDEEEDNDEEGALF